MCASSRRLWWTGNAPMGITTSTNRWWSSPTHTPCCPGPPISSRHIQTSCLCDQPLGEFRIHAPVTDCVGIRQRRAPNRSAKAHMPELRGLRRQAGLDIAQAFTVCQLSERHGPVLLGARECLHRVVTLIACDDPSECAPRQAIHQLCQQRLSGVHGRFLPAQGSGKSPPNSNRHHQNSAKSHYKSDISERFVRITPDSSEHIRHHRPPSAPTSVMLIGSLLQRSR